MVLDRTGPKGGPKTRESRLKGLVMRAHNLPEAFKTNKSRDGSLKVDALLSHAY